MKTEGEENDTNGKEEKTDEQKEVKEEGEAPKEAQGTYFFFSQLRAQFLIIHSFAEAKKEEKKSEPEVTTPPTKRVTDEYLIAAFRYFDRTQAGYIRDDDMEAILHNLGMCLSRHTVQQLLKHAATEYSAKSSRVYYERIAEKEIPVEGST